jgi:hypothetical protein
MKLLHEFTRLRSRIQLRLTGVRNRQPCYVVTVPAPLGRLTVAAPPSATHLGLPAIADNDTSLSALRVAGNC